MNSDLLLRYVELIAARTGLHVREKDRADLARALEARAKVRGIAPEELLQLLAAEKPDQKQDHRKEVGPNSIQNAPQNSIQNRGEWNELLPLLTNGESYFLRDKGQFALLRTRILPALIARRAASKSLRVWSAGCSTGEEAYSLAMLLEELLPAGAGWNVSILGTDINQAGLQKARRGVYGEWAFRSVEASVRARYFDFGPGGMEIKASLRERVKFSKCNLRDADFFQSVSAGADIDLIVCRNVLIYFRPDAIAHALRGFAVALRPGGWLLTGHAELAGHDPAPLVTRAFSESVAFERPVVIGPTAGRSIEDAKTPIFRSAGLDFNSGLDSTPAPGQTSRPLARQVPLAPREIAPCEVAAKPVESPAKISAVPATTQSKTQSLSAQARDLADLGQHERALELCRDAIAADPMEADAYFVWAQVAQERGDAARAKALLKQVIYLAPARVEAHLELAALYESENDATRARRRRETALELLRALPPQTPLAALHGTSVAELMQQVQTLLAPAPKPAAKSERAGVPNRADAKKS